MREAQQRMDAREFAEWLAFSRIEPPADHVVQGLLAQLCAMFFNANRGKDAESMQPIDFLPHLERPEKRPKDEAMSDQNLKYMLYLTTLSRGRRDGQRTVRPWNKGKAT